MKFKLNKLSSTDMFEVLENETKEYRVTVIKDKRNDTYGVYVKRYVKVNWWIQGFIEISDHLATNLTEVKHVAEKMVDIVLWYKVPTPWNEQ